jgi:xanthine dehydrogenase molybdopterin-binding subunit B
VYCTFAVLADYSILTLLVVIVAVVHVHTVNKQAARLSPAQVAVLAEESAANNSSNSDIDGLAIPETLMMDQYRLVVIAAGIEQVMNGC